MKSDAFLFYGMAIVLLGLVAEYGGRVKKEKERLAELERQKRDQICGTVTLGGNKIGGDYPPPPPRTMDRIFF